MPGSVRAAGRGHFAGACWTPKNNATPLGLLVACADSLILPMGSVTGRSLRVKLVGFHITDAIACFWKLQSQS